MPAVSLSMGTDWVRGVPDRDRLQHTLVLGRSGVGVTWARLSLSTC